MAQAENNRKITIEAILAQAQGLALFQEDPKLSGNDKEYLLTLKCKANLASVPKLQNIHEEEVEYLLILDRSGSMAGSPWKQVQQSVLNIMKMVKGNPKLALTVMTYSGKAEFLVLPNDFEAARNEIETIKAKGTTDFVKAFEKLARYLESRNNAVDKAGKPTHPNMVVYFMTDGCDMCNTHEKIMATKASLKKTIKSYGSDVLVHVLGFGINHNEEFLESLSLIGTSDGTYNFIDPSLGAKALQERMTELLAGVTELVGRLVYLKLKLGGNSNAFLGDWFGTSTQTMVISAFFKVQGEIVTIETTKFVQVEDERDFQLEVELLENLQDSTIPMPCVIAKVEFLKDIPESAQECLNIRKLRTGFNFITTRIGEADSETLNKKDLENLRPCYEQLRNLTTQAQVRIPKEQRESNQDLGNLLRAAEVGLSLTKRVMEPHESEDPQVWSKNARGVRGAYNLGTNQMQNVMQNKSRARAPGDRSNMQMGQGLRD